MKKLSFLLATTITILSMIGCKKGEPVNPVTPVVDSVKIIKASPSDRGYINEFEGDSTFIGSQMVDGKNYPITKGSWCTYYGSTNGEIYVNNVRVTADTLRYSEFEYNGIVYPAVNIGLFYIIK